MKAVIEILNGAQQGLQAEVHKDGPMVILGRGKEADFQILDPLLSRKHCSLRYGPNGPMVLDLGSSNGTFLNGTQIHLALIPDGAELRLGGTRLRVLISEAAPAAKVCHGCAREITLDELMAGRFEAQEELVLCAECSTRGVALELTDPQAQTVRDLPAEPKLPPSSLPLDGLDGFAVHGEVGTTLQGPLVHAEHELMRKEMLLAFLDKDQAENPQVLHNFLEVGKLAARFQHNHLTRVLEVCPFADTYFVSMECLGMISLWDEVTACGALELQPAFHSFVGVLRGLHFLHEQQIVHGSLTPSKIVLGNDGLARLSFFDLLFTFDPALLPGPYVPQYFLAPERHHGHPGSVQGDVYAAGAILYYALSGMPPYGEVPPPQLKEAMAEFEPAPVPRPDVPEMLGNVMWQCLAPEPSQRYASCLDALFDLNAV